jgi:hypothetical protein
MYRLVVSAVAIAAAFAVAECTTRFAYRQDASTRRAADLVSVSSGGAPSSLNSLGFRERPIEPKDPNRFRIAVIGDSFSWGQGLRDHERFSNLLDTQLGARYEVLNFGMPGHTMPEHVDELEPVLKLNPDFVLLQLYINNFETPGMRRPSAYPLLPADLNARLTEASLVYQLLADRWAQLQESLGLVDSYARARRSASCVNSSAGPGPPEYRRARSSFPPPIRWARTASITPLVSSTTVCKPSARKNASSSSTCSRLLHTPATRTACGSPRSTRTPTPWRTDGRPPRSSMRSQSRGAADRQRKKGGSGPDARFRLEPSRRGILLELDARAVRERVAAVA